MDNLIKALADAVDAACADLQARTECAGSQMGLVHYLSILEPSLKKYQHHLGGTPSGDDLRRRYHYETALLHMLTQMLAQDLKHRSSITYSAWPVHSSESPYSWYAPPDHLVDTARRLSAQLPRSRVPGLVASEICSRLFADGARTYLGEFYTPLLIAQHLVALTGFKPEHLFGNQPVCDPACGNGIILSVIAEKVLAYGKSHGYSADVVFRALANNLYGLDVQPFAVAATKTLLGYSCLSSYHGNPNLAVENLFPNVQLTDPLSSLEVWSSKRLLHYVIGNPPFMAAKKALIDFVGQYEEIIDGHPNLFQLFLWWAVKAVEPGGIISYLLPQSILAGFYFRRLRKELLGSTSLLRVTRILDHRGVFGGADQQMMAASFQVAQEVSRPDMVEIRVTRDGTELAKARPYRAAYSRVVHSSEEEGAPWVVSDSALDYTICKRLEDNCSPLGDLWPTYRFGNGGYVWNQNKQLVQQEEAGDSWPLLCASSIRPYVVEFPYLGPRASRARQFSLVDSRVRGLAHSEPALLVQRTTPRKVGRRLIAGIPPDAFFARYQCYFLENHVNFVKVAEGEDTGLLYGLMLWLNSELVNFVFQLRNGTAQVSLYELGLLPANLTLIRKVTWRGRAIAQSDPGAREGLIKAADDEIYNWLGLGTRYRTRVASVLKPLYSSHA